MAKRFKLRFCRAIANTLQSCRSNDASNSSQDSVPPISRPGSKNPNHHRSPSIDGPEQFKWEKEEKWHVVANVHQEPTPRRKTYNSSASCVGSEDGSRRRPAAERRKRRTKRKKRNGTSRLRESTSSGDSGWFSCDEGGSGRREETETLVSSSLTLSTDSSSEFNLHHVPLNPIRKLSKPTKRRAESEDEIPARLSMFMKLTPCVAEGKIKESFAIVKRSENPYEDFKNSMIDMIVEKQMFESGDLEQLLQCFLSLNSQHYHGIIIQAFCEIWDAIFSAQGSKVSAGLRFRPV